MNKLPLVAGLLLAGSLSVTGSQEASKNPDAVARGESPVASAPGKKEIQPPVAPEQAPPPSPRLDDVPGLERLDDAMAAYFADPLDGRERRQYLQADKPLYRPGETVWLKTWDLGARSLNVGDDARYILLELVNPKGAVSQSRRVETAGGAATADFIIDSDAPGGVYTLRYTAWDGQRAEREIIVSAYEPPRIKKKLEFVRKAYGPGDTVKATLRLEEATGEAMADQAATAVVWMDGAEIGRHAVTTNSEGGALVSFELPPNIQVGDALLTILVEDGGVTESISRKIPIVLNRMQLSFFPEGGALVSGLPSRVYFEALTPLGKPADVSGWIEDDRGQKVARYESYKNGRGRFEFTPSTGRRYEAVIAQPVGIAERYALPLAEEEGCVLRSFDDPDGQIEALRAQVRCSDEREVVVAAVQRGHTVDVAAAVAGPREPAVVYLEGGDEAATRSAGVARITVFDAESLLPLAERVVFRNRRARLHVEVEAEPGAFAPRDEVTLTIRTTDDRGEGIASDIALSVVDDTVLSFADDKSGHLLSKLLLEPELPGEVEEPNFYLDLEEAQSAMALEHLMGTRGWRRFEWQPVLSPAPEPSIAQVTGLFAPQPEWRDMALEGAPMPVARPRRAMAKLERAEAEAPPVDEMQAQMDMGPMPKEVAQPNVPVAGEAIAVPERDEMANKRLPVGAFADDEDFFAAREAPVLKPGGGQQAPLVAARVFPAPRYTGGPPAVRTDFRDTVFWAPSIRTNSRGKATVSFHLSDAVTSFRATAEGVGGGLAGRDEAVVESSLPFSMSVKLPLQVSAGDHIALPLSFENRTSRPLELAFEADFGELLSSRREATSTIDLGSEQKTSRFLDLEVTGLAGQSTVRFSAEDAGLQDTFERQISVVPLGFPIDEERGGEVTDVAEETITIGDIVPGSIEASVRLYPSTLSTLVSGMEGMLREPHGCFEQTSSSNYPNVMITRYLEQHDVVAPELAERSNALMDRGYNKLVGYETQEDGYEWFGANPGHEALTAYGLMEFVDMQEVYPGVDTDMVNRTAKWLLKRRDGEGGFAQNAKALDSFGRASEEVTNAYITMALTDAGYTDLEAELKRQSEAALKTADPYILTLATHTLLNVGHPGAPAAVGRLKAMQGDDGAWTGADHSITRSGGENLTIETTALAVTALIKADAHRRSAELGVDWLTDHRGGYGQWGATQATVLALDAMTAWARASKVIETPGVVRLEVNGEVVAKVAYEAGRREPVLFEGFGSHLNAGKNRVRILHDGEAELPYSINVTYRSMRPVTAEGATVGVETALERSELKMGEAVRLTAKVINLTAKGQPMALARVGIPGGMSFQNWQLKDLVEAGKIAFYETEAREVVLYFRQLEPGETRIIPLDLIAAVPGRYTAPPSSAYLYYTDEVRSWTAGSQVTIVP